MVIFLLGGATLVTALSEGRAGVRRLFAGTIRWRMGVARFLVLVTAMPLLTLLVGALTDTLQAPAGGWLTLVGSYLFQTFIFGLLIVNLWEETAWGGFMQARLMARRGLLIGSLLTAIPFFVIHIPLAFAEHGWKDTTWAQAALDLGLIALVAPFFRYLLGTQLIDSGGSILAIGLLHASFNAAGQMSAVPGGWQYIPAMIILTFAVIAYRRWRGRSFTRGFAPALVADRRPSAARTSRSGRTSMAQDQLRRFLRGLDGTGSIPGVQFRMLDRSRNSSELMSPRAKRSARMPLASSSGDR